MNSHGYEILTGVEHQGVARWHVCQSRQEEAKGATLSTVNDLDGNDEQHGHEILTDEMIDGETPNKTHGILMPTTNSYGYEILTHWC